MVTKVTPESPRASDQFVMLFADPVDDSLAESAIARLHSNTDAALAANLDAEDVAGVLAAFRKGEYEIEDLHWIDDETLTDLTRDDEKLLARIGVRNRLLRWKRTNPHVQFPNFASIEEALSFLRLEKHGGALATAAVHSVEDIKDLSDGDIREIIKAPGPAGRLIFWRNSLISASRCVCACVSSFMQVDLGWTQSC